MVIHATDRYGRLVGEVLLPNGRNLGQELVRAGLAWWYRQYAPLADGMSLVQIAATVGITRRFVYTWAQRFLQDGLEGLTDKPGRGRRAGPRSGDMP